MSGIVTSEEALATLTEWNLATLEELEMLKSSPATRIRRQQNICKEAVMYCRLHGGVAVAKKMRCMRLVDLLGAE